MHWIQSHTREDCSSISGKLLVAKKLILFTCPILECWLRLSIALLTSRESKTCLSQTDKDLRTLTKSTQKTWRLATEILKTSFVCATVKFLRFRHILMPSIWIDSILSANRWKRKKSKSKNKISTRIRSSHRSRNHLSRWHLIARGKWLRSLELKMEISMACSCSECKES